MRSIYFIALITAVVSLTGCAFAPGMSMNAQYGETSSVSVPIRSPSGKEITTQIYIQEISGDLIQKQEQTQSAILSVKHMVTKAEYSYHVGPGDILNITVWDHPELTIPAGQYRDAVSAGRKVGPDGMLFYPFAGTVNVNGMTVQEIREVLTNKLSNYIENVQLDVMVADFQSQRVYVVGEVTKPGIYPVNDIPMSILEAVNRAGGFTERSDRRNLTLTRQNESSQIDLLSLYENGDASRNIQLEHGDVLYVPDRSNNKVFVLGEVNKPSSYLMENGRMTLAEALSDAGGVDQDSSNPANIFVIRARNDPSIFHLDASSPDALILADRFPLSMHDVVYVDTAKVVRWNRVISRILPTIQSLQFASDTQFPLYRTFGN